MPPREASPRWHPFYNALQSYYHRNADIFFHSLTVTHHVNDFSNLPTLCLKRNIPAVTVSVMSSDIGIASHNPAIPIREGKMIKEGTNITKPRNIDIMDAIPAFSML